MDPAGTAFHFRYSENGNVSAEAKLEVLRAEMQDYASSLPEGVGAQIFIIDHGDVGSPDNQTPAGFGSTHNYIAYSDFFICSSGQHCRGIYKWLFFGIVTGFFKSCTQRRYIGFSLGQCPIFSICG